MRILRVAQNVYPEQNGGACYHVHAMSRDQAAMDHEVTVLTGRDDPDQPGVEEREGYIVVRVALESPATIPATDGSRDGVRRAQRVSPGRAPFSNRLIRATTQ